MSKWITIDKYHINEQHIVEYHWNATGVLFLTDDAPLEDGQSTVRMFQDPKGEKYRNICDQLEINVSKEYRNWLKKENSNE